MNSKASGCQPPGEGLVGFPAEVGSGATETKGPPREAWGRRPHTRGGSPSLGPGRAWLPRGRLALYGLSSWRKFSSAHLKTLQSVIKLGHLKLETISKGTSVPGDLEFYMHSALDSEARARTRSGSPSSPGASACLLARVQSCCLRQNTWPCPREHGLTGTLVTWSWLWRRGAGLFHLFKQRESWTTLS